MGKRGYLYFYMDWYSLKLAYKLGIKGELEPSIIVSMYV